MLVAIRRLCQGQNIKVRSFFTSVKFINRDNSTNIMFSASNIMFIFCKINVCDKNLGNKKPAQGGFFYGYSFVVYFFSSNPGLAMAAI